MREKQKLPTTGSIRVLVVDDEEFQIELTKLSLEDADPILEILLTPSAAEALKILQSQHIDCVVSDFSMPGMDGIQFCREVKTHSQTPFIIYTGKGSEEVAEAAFKAGADDYLRKEKAAAHFLVLARRIRHLVERRRVEEALRESINPGQATSPPQDLRRSGLEPVGDVPWGTHFCLFYRTKQDLVDTLVPYFVEGLRGGEYCMWVTADPLEKEDAEAAMERAVPDFKQYKEQGQIEILSYRDWYLKGGAFDAQNVLNSWVERMNSAIKRGYKGLRLTGNTFWLEPERWDAFTDYERMVEDAIGDHRMIALCTYSLEKCGTEEIIDVIKNHQFALLKRLGKWEKIESSDSRRFEVALRSSEDRFHALFNSMTEGFALCKIILDDQGKPVDFLHIDVNPAYERLVEIPPGEVEGKTIKELIPGIEEYWIDALGAVALTGQPATMENLVGQRRRISAHAYSPERGYFVIVFEDVTERKRAEEELRERERQLTAILTGSPIPMFVVDSDVVVTQVNPSVESFTGRGAEQLIGLRAGEAIRCLHSLDDPDGCGYGPSCKTCMVRGSVNATLKGGREIRQAEAELHLINDGGGKTINVLVSTVPVTISGEAKVLVCIEDITKLKEKEGELEKAHLELQVNHEELQKFTEETQAINEELRVTNENLTAAEEELRASNEELSASNEELASTEEELRTTNEELTSINDTLSESEERFRATYEQAAVGIEMLDLDGRFLRGNDTLSQILGYSHEEIRKLRFSDLTDAEDLKREQLLLSDLLDDTVRSYTIDKRYIRKTGERVWVRVTSSIAKTSRPYRISIIEDITAQKKLEEELRTSNEELRATNENLGAAEEELRASNEELQSKNEELQAIEEELRVSNEQLQQLNQRLDATNEELKSSEEDLQKYNATLESTVAERTREITIAKDRLETASLYNRSLLEASLDPLVTISAVGKITDVNLATELVTGVERERLIGSDFSDYFTEPEKARIGYRRVFDKGQVTDYPLAIRHTSGKVTDVLYNAAVYRNPLGEIIGIFAAARDVTSLNKAEANLRAASLYTRSLIEASQDPLVTISVEGKITDVNEATVQVTGVTRRKLIGSDFSDYFTDPEKARIGYRRVFEKGQVTDYPLAIRHTSGKATDVLYNATVYRKPDGQIAGIFAAARDVTSLKRAEAELIAASLYTRSLIEASLDPLVTINPAGRITDVNAATELVTGMDRTHLIGSDFSDYFTEPEKARIGYRRVFEEGQVRDYPLAIRHSSGKVTDVLYNATVYRDEAGEVKGIFAAARDVTRRKEVEERLQAASHYSRSLIEASLDPLVTINADGKITDVNEATIQATGVPREKLIGSEFADYFTEPEKAREGRKKSIRRGLRTGLPPRNTSHLGEGD